MKVKQGLRKVTCKYCEREFKTYAGNKKHCGDARDNQTCAGRYRLDKMRERRAALFVVPEPPKPKTTEEYTTPRLQQLALVRKNNRKFVLIRKTAPST